MLDRKSYFIREHVGVFKLADTYDILDPETQEQIGVAKESPGPLVTMLRLLVGKALLPTRVHFYEGEDPAASSPILTIRRGIKLLRPKVDVLDGNGNLVGWFRAKLLSIGMSFRVFDADGKEFAEVKGDWKGWNFSFEMGGEKIGSVTKEWAGLGKELFTSADNYVIDIFGDVDPGKSALLLAAGVAIDTVFKEK